VIGFLHTVRTLASRALGALAGLAVLAMVALACGNIAGRALGSPITGSYELMGFLGAVAAAFALGSSQLAKGHVAVTILDPYLPKTARRLLDALGALVGAAFFAVAGYEVFELARFMISTGELSETLRLPYYPFVWAVSAGCAVMALVLLTDVLLALGPQRPAAPAAVREKPADGPAAREKPA